MRTGHDFISRMTDFQEDSYGEYDLWKTIVIRDFWFDHIIFSGVTVPLILNEHGEKLGKSVGNALWLDDNLSTPYECYQVIAFFLIDEARTSSNFICSFFAIHQMLKLKNTWKYLHFFRWTKSNNSWNIIEYAIMYIRQQMSQSLSFLPGKTTRICCSNKTGKRYYNIDSWWFVIWFVRRIRYRVGLFYFCRTAKGLESAIRSTEAMFAQNIDLLHNLTQKEIDGLSMSVPTFRMTLNPGKRHDLHVYEKCDLLLLFY